jgi:hypothetical protein
VALDGSWQKKEIHISDWSCHSHLWWQIWLSMHFAICCGGNNKTCFEDLTKWNLLQKCLYSEVQNPNESVNSIIWTHIAKTVFMIIKTLNFGV